MATNPELMRKYSDILAESSRLDEAVTSVLANIKTKAAEGSLSKAMSAESLVNFLCGVEWLAQALPRVEDSSKKRQILSMLDAVTIGGDNKVSTHAATIAEYGLKKGAAYKPQYEQIISDILGSDQQKKSAALASLSKRIDKLMQSVGSLVSVSVGNPVRSMG